MFFILHFCRPDFESQHTASPTEYHAQQRTHSFRKIRTQTSDKAKRNSHTTPNGGTTNEYANIVTHTHENQNQMSSDVTSDEKKKKGIIIKN